MTKAAIIKDEDFVKMDDIATPDFLLRAEHCCKINKCQANIEVSDCNFELLRATTTIISEFGAEHQSSRDNGRPVKLSALAASPTGPLMAAGLLLTIGMACLSGCTSGDMLQAVERTPSEALARS
jgi:hypothetical protein